MNEHSFVVVSGVYRHAAIQRYAPRGRPRLTCALLTTLAAVSVFDVRVDAAVTSATIVTTGPTSELKVVAQWRLKDDATIITRAFTVNPTSRLTIHADDVVGLEAAAVFATVTSTSGLPLAVERTMSRDATGYGSRGGTALDEPRTLCPARRKPLTYGSGFYAPMARPSRKPIS